MSRSTSRVSRVVITGPLAPFADQYRKGLAERGYSRLSAVNLERQVGQMSRWLESEGLGVEQLSEALIEAFLERASGRERSSLSRPGLLCLLELLRELGVVAAPVEPPPSPAEALMGSFERYLLSERGLSAGTVRGYVDGATRFVAGLVHGGVRHVTSAEVTAAVLRESATVSVSATQNFVASLRAFLASASLKVSSRSTCRRRRCRSPAGGVRRCRGESPRTMPTRCSAPATGAPRSDGAITR